MDAVGEVNVSRSARPDAPGVTARWAGYAHGLEVAGRFRRSCGV